jgi:starvation-inducible DNA-binding protein
MPIATNVLSIEPPAGTNPTTGQNESKQTIEVLEELLVQAIHLRDLYKNARLQTADVQFLRFRQLFDGHYQEQVRLVDVLLDRIRMLNGAGRVFAGDFLQREHLSQSPRGRASVTRLLLDLVDAHESALNAAQPEPGSDGSANYAWTRDFAVGQVVLGNHQQLLAVREQLVHRERALRTQPLYD